MTVSIVTGGNRGLGRNTAVSIARHGGDVILTYRTGADQAKAVVAEIEGLGRKAVALQLDVGATSTFPAFVKNVRSALRSTWGNESFDHLVNNAGHG
jgi:NAD(P)-dependent dehydrogenase (short-subunit alcohol dehydrogenase family)